MRELRRRWIEKIECEHNDFSFEIWLYWLMASWIYTPNEHGCYEFIQHSGSSALLLLVNTILLLLKLRSARIIFLECRCPLNLLLKHLLHKSFHPYSEIQLIFSYFLVILYIVTIFIIVLPFAQVNFCEDPHWLFF